MCILIVQGGKYRMGIVQGDKVLFSLTFNMVSWIEKKKNHKTCFKKGLSSKQNNNPFKVGTTKGDWMNLKKKKKDLYLTTQRLA